MQDWWAFVLVLWVTLVVPGPDFVVIGSAAIQDRRRALRVVLGVLTGLGVHTVLAAVGLGALLSSVPQAIAALRLIGGLVLVWFGAMMVFGRRTEPDGDRRETPNELRHPYQRGFLVNVTNPKALLFFVAVLPQFMAPGPAAIWYALGLGSTVIVSAALWWFAVLALAGLSRPDRHPRLRALVPRIGGSILAAMGVALVAQAPLG